MTVSRKVELISGILTGLLALAVSFTLTPPLSALQFLRLLMFYLGPALLVAVGSYVHAIQRKTVGLVMLLIGGSILTIMIVMLTVGGVFYFYGLWGATKINSISHGNPDYDRFVIRFVDKPKETRNFNKRPIEELN